MPWGVVRAERVPKSPAELLRDLDAVGKAFSQAAQQEFGGKGEW
jgi:hypothetical protein